MESTAKEIMQYLADNGVGAIAATSGWSLGVSREIERPDTAITLYDTGGGEPNPDIELYESTFQVRVRGRDYLAAYDKQQEIRDLLILPTVRQLGENGLTRYIGIWMQSDILNIGRDDNDRILLTANYRVQRQPTEVS